MAYEYVLRSFTLTYLLAIRLISLDLGCGFNENIGHESLREAIGIDLNFHRGQVSVNYPIISDVCNLPVRSHCIQFIHAHAILEHLARPQDCLKEMKRTMARDGHGSVLIPVDSYNIRQILNRFVKEFPFSLGWVFQKLVRSVTLWKIPGMLHISQVNIEDVEKWFKIEGVSYRKRLHKWFVHATPLVILIKLGLLKTRLTVEEYAEVVIKICP